ncbi:MAG TPA: hypothetical protein VGO14_09330 [Solirubrobacteraceae bacterium]|nr:hypothetical protein [Solirubrobacteraceae bacterium]
MSFSPQPGHLESTDAAADPEVIDALPVLAGEAETLRVRPVGGALSRSGGAVIPAVQAAAVAAGGFVAGAAVVGLVQRRQRHSTSAVRRGRRRGGRQGRTVAAGGELLQIVSSRSLLVDVHLLGPAGPQR